MSPTRSRERPPPRNAGAAEDEDFGGVSSVASPTDVRLGGLAPAGGDGMGAGGGGSPRRGSILGQSESAALRRIEAQMEVSRRERMQMTNEEYVTGFFVLSCLIQHAHFPLLAYSNLAERTRSRLQMHEPLHQLQGLRSYKQGA